MSLSHQPPAPKRKQLKLRRILQPNQQQQQKRRGEERAILAAERSRGMDTRSVSNPDAGGGVEGAAAQQQLHTTTLLLPSLSPGGGVGGIEQSASGHEEVVAKSMQFTTPTSAQVPLLLQPNARDSRKKDRPYPVPLRKAHRTASLVDPEGAVWSSSAPSGASRTTAATVDRAAPKLPSGATVAQLLPPVAAALQTLKNSPPRTHQPPASSALSTTKLLLSPPRTDTASKRRMQSSEVRSVAESGLTAFGEEVSVGDMPNAVQHLSPIDSTVVAQQQQRHHTLFLQKQASTFATKADRKNAPVDGADKTPPRQRQLVASMVAAWEQSPVARAPLSPSDVERTPVPPPAAYSSSRRAADDRDAAAGSVEQTPVRPTPSRDRADRDDKQLSTTPVQANRSPPEQLRRRQQQQQRDRRGDDINTNDDETSNYAPSAARRQRSSGQPPSALLKAALSRPFGREPAILPPSSTSTTSTTSPHGWVVEVSTAEWDADQQQWKYRILVQRRQSAEPQAQSILGAEQDQLQLQSSSSFTTAFTWRSVADFFWLETALQQEFHGALLPPSLSIALGHTVEVASEMPVESLALKLWLSDVLNGVRGSGEWILPIVQPDHLGKLPIDMIKCESMETFLYRNAVGSTLNDAAAPFFPKSPNSPHDVDGTAGECNDPASFVTSLFHTAMAVSPLELCAGPQPGTPRSQEDYTSRHGRRHTNSRSRGFPKPSLPLGVMNCSSRALGTATDFSVQDSFVDSSSIVSGMNSVTPRGSSALVMHSELLFAQRDLSRNYRTTALAAMDTLRALNDQEEKVGVAWKRFAISLANLFAYEKDVESANVGESKVKKENMPFRKVEKSTIDECLRAMARQKTDRAVPGLTALSAMLSAYIADLSSVETSVDVYSKTVDQILLGPPPTEAGLGHTGGTSSPSSVGKRGLSGRHWDGLKDWTIKSLNKKGASAGDNNNRVQRRQDAQAAQLDGLKTRLLTNEKLLRISLTGLFRTIPFRISRMAWRYWNTEASQCAMMNLAAAELRSQLDVVSQTSVSKLLKRHSKDEKSDCAVEMELVQRVVNLGQRRMFPSGADSATDGSISTTSINNELVEVDNDDLSEERAKALKRDKALDIARHRIGRWNAVLAMSMMEAVGVDDPNVRVEETTRDLRLVRKYAIGLRECLNRCVESVRLLQEAITGNALDSKQNGPASTPTLPTQNSGPNQLKSRRNEFLVEMSLLFSGTYVDTGGAKPKRSSASMAVLHNAGIDTTDPSGWIPLETALTQRGSKTSSFHSSVGNLAVRYVNARDAQVEWLVSSLDGLLSEYYQRIEVIEGFVYMECVGIQLEKHFNAKRAKALMAFEKKTDLTAAMNMARKKRMPQLLEELQMKLEKLGPKVSHTSVKETKESHLESKNLKTSLHELAMRRLMRARETSTERAITIMSLWTKEEEINATEEIKALGEAMSALEKSVGQEDLDQILSLGTRPNKNT